MSHIVVLGAGLGGIPMANELRDIVRKDDRVTVISDRDHFQFTPSNPWVAVNWRSPDQITVKLEPVLKKRGIDFLSGGAKRVHPDENRVELNGGESVAYDYLVIATGPELAFDEIEGLGPKGFTQSICTTEHAVEASKAWEEFLANPGPVVIGAVQGASCFGPAYEFAFIVDTELRRRKLRDKVPMTFVTSEPYIGHLGLDGVGDTKGLLESELRDRHIKWITNASVEKVEKRVMTVAEHDMKGEETERRELPFKYSMILPAFRGIPAVMGIEGLTNPRGFITVDKHQRNQAFPNVYSVGVCIAIAPPEPTPVATGVPKTGFMIESMVTAAAHNIRRALDGAEPDTEATWNALCLADLGDSGIAFLAMPQIPPRNVNWASQGKWVHLAKVAFEKYFLRKVRKGTPEPTIEKYIMKMLGVEKLKTKAVGV